MTPNAFMFFVWLLMMTAIIFYLGLVIVLWRNLSANEPAMWESLGKPLFLNNKPKHSILFMRWILLRSYRQIEHPKSLKIAKATYVMFWISCTLVVLTFATGFATRGGTQWPN